MSDNQNLLVEAFEDAAPMYDKASVFYDEMMAIKKQLIALNIENFYFEDKDGIDFKLGDVELSFTQDNQFLSVFDNGYQSNGDRLRSFFLNYHLAYSIEEKKGEYTMYVPMDNASKALKIIVGKQLHSISLELKDGKLSGFGLKN